MSLPNQISPLNSNNVSLDTAQDAYPPDSHGGSTQPAISPLQRAAVSDGAYSLHDRNSTEEQSEGHNEKEKRIVTWRSLPHKGQLAVLTLARLSEPLVQTSLQSYMFYQLKSFDTTLPDAVIARQAGLMQGSFTGAQFMTAMMWGKIADSDRGGRKTVLMIGLLGTRKIEPHITLYRKLTRSQFCHVLASVSRHHSHRQLYVEL